MQFIENSYLRKRLESIYLTRITTLDIYKINSYYKQLKFYPTTKIIESTDTSAHLSISHIVSSSLVLIWKFLIIIKDLS